MFDGKAFGAEMVEIVKGHLAKALNPVLSRLDALEKRQPERGEAGRDGANGTDGAAGADGRDGADGKDGERGEDGKDGAPGEKGRDGKDGVGLAGALIDRDGVLVVTLTDGTTRNLGPVVGKDGSDGSDGVAGVNGQDGKNGADGLGFDDLEVVQTGARGFSFRFTKGDRVKAFDFSLPVVLDCGVFKEGQSYEAGDGVTWGGSYWIAQKATDEKPGVGDGWRLAVKKGRDGKDGTVKSAADPKPLRVG